MANISDFLELKSEMERIANRSFKNPIPTIDYDIDYDDAFIDDCIESLADDSYEHGLEDGGIKICDYLLNKYFNNA